MRMSKLVLTMMLLGATCAVQAEESRILCAFFLL